MADRATLRLFLLALRCAPRSECDVDETSVLVSSQIRLILPDYVHMLVVREIDAEIRNRVLSSRRVQDQPAETRKRKTHGVARTDLDVAVRADAWSGTLAREELLLMAPQTGSVFRKLRHVRERSITFANLFPVLRWKLVTLAARLLVLFRAVREFGVINARRFFGDLRSATTRSLRASLRFSFSTRLCGG